MGDGGFRFRADEFEGVLRNRIQVSDDEGDFFGDDPRAGIGDFA